MYFPTMHNVTAFANTIFNTGYDLINSQTFRNTALQVQKTIIFGGLGLFAFALIPVAIGLLTKAVTYRANNPDLDTAEKVEQIATGPKKT